VKIYLLNDTLTIPVSLEVTWPVNVDDFITQQIDIYPNPTNGVVNITGLGSETKITVTDVRGQVVFSTEPLNSGLFSFDLSGSNPGVYFVNIQKYLSKNISF